MTEAVALLPLSVDEIGQLKHWEGVVDTNLKGFELARDALLKIYEAGLYREFGSWSTYIQTRWGDRILGKSRSYDLLEEARTARRIDQAKSTMVDSGDVPPATGRALRALSEAPEDEQGQLYIEKAKELGRAPTGREIEQEIASRRAEANPASDDEDERARALFAQASPKAELRSTAPPPTRILTRGAAQIANERYTDPVYIEAARRVLGAIDVDPASCDEANQVVQASIFFDEATNGLDKHWFGRVWLNPPYGVDEDGASNMGRWATELLAQYDHDIVTAAILCVNCLPFAPWWKQLKDLPVCMTDHRPRFRKPVGVEPDKHGPTNGSAFFYLGPDVEAFVREFDQFGPIYGRLKPARS